MFKDITRSIQQLEEPQIKELTKNEEALKHKIRSILRQYETLKEWSDLGQWQLKLQQVLQDHPCGYLPKKRLFCKRLAQCLSPVWNKAIHECALQIYDLILHNLTTQKNSKNPNYQLIDDLPLFSLGLLPFFGISSQQCKPKVLEILQKYYYPLGVQLMPVMGGIISSVIVGMEDTNEEMMKKVLNSLDMACDCVGVRTFYGALWMSIVRSSRTRLGAFKFLNKRWNKAKQKEFEEQSVENQPQSEIIDNGSIILKSQMIQDQLQKIVEGQDKMPNKSALVINALLASLEDESSLIKRGALDFLSSFARIEDSVFSQNENLLLVQGCLLLFMKVDHAVVRRINNWFFGDLDLNDTEKLRKNQIIKLIAEALNRILEEFKPEPIIDENQQNNTPLKIIQNWYMQHPESVELTLEEIGFQLVKYMYKNRTDPLIQKASERLVESIASNCDLILESLFSLLQSRIKEVKVEQVLELVRLIKYALNVLMQNHFAASIKDDGDFEPYRQRTLSLQKLINLILSQVNQIPSKELYKLNLVESVLEIVLSSLDHLEKRVVTLTQYKRQQQQQQDEENKSDILILEGINFSKYQEAIDNFSKYYIELNKFSLANAQQIQQDGKIIVFQYMSKILIKTQLFIMRQLDVVFEVLPEWVYTLMISLQCENPLLSIASIETLLEILKQNDTHENIKKLSMLLTVNCNNNIKPLDELKALYQLQKIDSNPNYDTNYMMNVFQRLWSLLDYHYQDSKVIDLILYFSKTFPIIFTFVIESQFLLNESELETVIRRYQIFCRLTNPHFRKFSHENKGVGVLMMLNYLQHENPLMRHAAKTWLSETAPFFFRILDPLIERLIVQQVQGLPIYGDLTGYTYQHEFNIELVMETIKKLDLLLTNIKDWYVPYLQNAKISKIIQDKLKNQPSFGIKEVNDITYLDIILIILDRFICGTAWEQATPTFKKDNSRLNAICCEQFEAIFSNITTGQAKSVVFMKYIQSQLLFLKTLIVRGDLVMQIQILNLIKAYVLSVKEVEQVLPKNQKTELQKILTDKHFIQNMVNGLNNSKVFLLKSRYLNTIILSIYSVSEILPPSLLTDNVYLILNTLLALLRDHPYNKETQNRRKQALENENEDFYQVQQASMRRVSNFDYAQSQIFSNKKKEWKFNDFQTADLKDLANSSDSVMERNDMPIISSLSGENFEEIMTLSNSIKALLAYFFQYKDEIKDISDQTQSKNMIGGLLVDILTLNMLRFREKQAAAQKPLQVQQPQFVQFQGTSQMILKNMDLILKSFLQCWHLGHTVLYQEYFSSKGCIMYEFQKFEQLTESLFDQYNKLGVDLTDDKQIKSNILSILNPCACQFTAEFANACLDVWASEYSSEFYAEPIYNQNMYKLIELLAFLMIEPDEFISALMKSPRYAILSNFYSNRLPQKKGIFLVCQNQAVQENTFLFFIYVYLSINLTHNKEKLIKLWLTTLSMTKPLLNTKHLSTLCWLLELFYMMAWKYSPKEALHNNELRKELHLQIKTILINLSEICAERSKFTLMTVDYKQGFIATLHPNGPFSINVPFTPSIYELYLEYISTVTEEGEKNEEMFQLQWIQRIIFDPQKILGDELNGENFSRKCSLIAFKTLKRLAYITLINTYEANKGDRIIDMTKEFMSPLFLLMGNNTVEGQQIIIEAVSELLHSLLKNSREQYTKEFKKQILDIFNRTDFFKCSKRALKYWKEIIDFSSEKGELLADQLSGGGGISIFTVFTGIATLFSSKNSETIKRIKTFERVCFIIYSGAVDKYQSNINIIIDAILNAMKDISKQPPAIIVLIIFCIRILILRLSPQALNEIFRKIWPSLVSMLMEIFNVKKNQQADANVLLAALKLVELFSLYQLEEFYFYQWIFVFDYFGITIETKHKNEVDESFKTVDIQQPFQFTPCIAKQFPLNETYIINYQNQIFADQVQNMNAKKKRNVIIRDPFVEDALEVQRQAVYLCQYFIDINQQRVEFNPQQLENLIEEEFIKLDDYIFNI